MQADYQAYEYDPIDQYDSSDDDEDVASLRESEIEFPDEDRALRGWDDSRKFTHENDPEDAAVKHEFHMDRIRERDELIDNMIRNRVGNDPNNPIFRHDYVILEFVENGDLAHLIQRIEKAKGDKTKRVPNRVLWSFWLCCVLHPRSILSPSPFLYDLANAILSG